MRKKQNFFQKIVIFAINKVAKKYFVQEIGLLQELNFEQEIKFRATKLIFVQKVGENFWKLFFANFSNLEGYDQNER